MGEYVYLFVWLLANLIQLVGYTLVLVLKRLSVCSPHIPIVGIPFLEVGIGYFIKALHFPVTKVDFLDTVISFAIRVTAEGSQTYTAGLGTHIYFIKLKAFEPGGSLCGFFFKGRIQRDICLSVAHSLRDIYGSVANEVYYHKLV